MILHSESHSEWLQFHTMEFFFSLEIEIPIMLKFHLKLDFSSKISKLIIENKSDNFRAEFSVGGETKGSIRMRDEKKNRMNDGEWHTVTVEYYERVR